MITSADDAPWYNPAQMMGARIMKLKWIMAALVLLAGLSISASAQESTIKDARVGEWAVYSTTDGNMQERHQVTARRRNVVTVKVESIINGRTISSKTENHNINNTAFLRNASGNERIQAGGRTYNCIAVKRGQRTLYYSNEVPVTGLVAIFKNGRAIKEIINFGN